jgi:hypothetical protein
MNDSNVIDFAEAQELRRLKQAIKALQGDIEKQRLATTALRLQLEPELAVDVALTAYSAKLMSYQDQAKRLRKVFAELFEWALTMQALRGEQLDWASAAALVFEDKEFIRTFDAKIQARIDDLPNCYARLAQSVDLFRQSKAAPPESKEDPK